MAAQNPSPQNVVRLVQSASTGATTGPELHEPRDCETHGRYMARNFRGTRIWSGCPECRAATEQQAQQAAEAEQRQQRNQAWMARVGGAGIPERFQTRTLRNYVATLPGQQHALDFALRYADGFADVRKTGRCALLVGGVGTGKTHLAAGICLRVMRAGYTVMFCTVRELIRRVRATWARNAPETEADAIAALVYPDLLVLDEVGVQHSTEAEQFVLFDVLDGRYKTCKPSLLLSNLTVTEVEGVLGQRIFDRLREDGGEVVVFDWASARGSVCK